MADYCTVYVPDVLLINFLLFAEISDEAGLAFRLLVCGGSFLLGLIVIAYVIYHVWPRCLSLFVCKG